MKNITQSLLALVAVCGLVVACQKDSANSPQNTPSVNAAVWNKFVEKNGAQVQSFNLNSDQATAVKSTGNTTFEIPAQAFVRADGTPVSGQVTFKVQEFNRVSQLILNNQQTVTWDGKRMDSWGTFMVSAEQNGQTLQLREGKSIRASKKFVADNGISKSQVKNWIAEEGKGSIVWRAMDDNRNTGLDLRNETLELYITILNARYNWDFQFEDGNTRVVLNTEGFDGEVNAFFVPDNNIGALKFTETTGLGIATPKYLIPQGLEGKIIALAVQDEQWYVAQIEVNGSSYNGSPEVAIRARMESVSEEEVRAILNELDRRRGRRD